MRHDASPSSHQRGASPSAPSPGTFPLPWCLLADTLEIPGTLLVLARRFEKLERWRVGHTRALEEHMGDVERWSARDGVSGRKMMGRARKGRRRESGRGMRKAKKHRRSRPSAPSSTRVCPRWGGRWYERCQSPALEPHHLRTPAGVGVKNGVRSRGEVGWSGVRGSEVHNYNNSAYTSPSSPVGTGRGVTSAESGARLP
ncbi:hypothetical protein BV22DRAFT_319560 [Leucogyrophana mollusca]|uniref:Uncharacterized protein n=1 Tax=Leucogyrophana mollusca TaxID=85980 RepID=A0ACB8BNK2_9AGAM|nr:hypothetical protein BV22DRAFT_319560 [Leucogyrophana mollusca]